MSWIADKHFISICGSEAQAHQDHANFLFAIDALKENGYTWRDWERTYPDFDTAESHDLQIMGERHYRAIMEWIKNKKGEQK